MYVENVIVVLISLWLQLDWNLKFIGWHWLKLFFLFNTRVHNSKGTVVVIFARMFIIYGLGLAKHRICYREYRLSHWLIIFIVVISDKVQ